MPHAPRTKPLHWSLLILVMALVIYGPFLGFRFARVAGDDKVYVAQALEMFRSGHWFLQTWGGEPNYFKGPLHYLFLIAGMKVFGLTMWATLYMNLLLLVLGAVSFAHLLLLQVQKISADYAEMAARWGGIALLTTLGVYSFTFASQMELELVSFYIFAMYFAYRADQPKARWPHYALWISIGLAGWLKSPLHSVLLGTSTLLYWLVRGSLKAHLKKPQAWLALILGITAGIAGYLPALIHDRENFISTYWIRESVEKVSRGHPLESFWAVTTWLALPWSPLLWLSFTRLRQTWKQLALPLSFALPTVLFFVFHPYHSHIYDLPVIGPLLLIVGLSFFLGRGTLPLRLERWIYFFTASLFLCAAALFAAIATHFQPLPVWVPAVFLWIPAGGFLFAGLLWILPVILKLDLKSTLGTTLAGAILSFFSLGFFGVTLGEREMHDLRAILKSRPDVKVTYYNLDTTIWNEWGYLNFMLRRPVEVANKMPALEAAIKRRDWILVNSQDQLTHVKALIPSKASYRVHTWKRWRLQGKDAQGRSLYQEAWDKRDLSVLERDYFVISF
ncbi:hypothetical protein K2X30_13765 [bacterium]|nr:hypothetical protein [bacterium]